jgi:hypothetical protein
LLENPRNTSEIEPTSREDVKQDEEQPLSLVFADRVVRFLFGLKL